MRKTLTLLVLLTICAAPALAQSVGNYGPNAPPPESSLLAPVAGSGWGIPHRFEPYPGVDPVSRERFEVTILAELTVCAGIWSVSDCPQMRFPDGTLHAGQISGYVHEGPRSLLVERITYDPLEIGAGDAPSIVYVAVED
jgi:hypothetical protein